MLGAGRARLELLDGLDGQPSPQQVSIQGIGSLGVGDQRRVVDAGGQVEGFRPFGTQGRLGAIEFARGAGP